jgi:hypothetical protein
VPYSRIPSRSVLAAVIILATTSVEASELDTNGIPVPTMVSARSDFGDRSLIEDLAGRWSGSGSARYTDGSNESLRCVVTYAPQHQAGDMRQNIRCKGVNFELELRGAWSIKAGHIAGTWNETTYSLEGTLTGASVADGFNIAATSSFADAKVNVRIDGCQQNITMRFSQQVEILKAVLKKC